MSAGQGGRPKTEAPLSAAERAKRSRERGRPVSCVLRDPAAIAALDRQTTTLTQGEAIARALVFYDRLSSGSRKAT